MEYKKRYIVLLAFLSLICYICYDIHQPNIMSDEEVADILGIPKAKILSKDGITDASLFPGLDDVVVYELSEATIEAFLARPSHEINSIYYDDSYNKHGWYGTPMDTLRFSNEYESLLFHNKEKAREIMAKACLFLKRGKGYYAFYYRGDSGDAMRGISFYALDLENRKLYEMILWL